MCGIKHAVLELRHEAVRSGNATESPIEPKMAALQPLKGYCPGSQGACEGRMATFAGWIRGPVILAASLLPIGDVPDDV